MDKESLKDYIMEHRRRLMIDFIEAEGLDDKFIEFCKYEYFDYLEILRTDNGK